MRLNLEVRDLFVYFKLDTGAGETLIHASLYNALNRQTKLENKPERYDPGYIRLIVICSL